MNRSNHVAKRALAIAIVVNSVIERGRRAPSYDRIWALAKN